MEEVYGIPKISFFDQTRVLSFLAKRLTSHVSISWANWTILPPHDTQKGISRFYNTLQKKAISQNRKRILKVLTPLLNGL